MLISTFSSHEIYAKHHYQAEIRLLEQHRHVIEACSYRYGNPLNTSHELPADAGDALNNEFRTAKPFTFALLWSLFFTR